MNAGGIACVATSIRGQPFAAWRGRLELSVELAAGCAHELVLSSPLEKDVEPVVTRRLAPLEPGQILALTVQIPTAERRRFSATLVQRTSRAPLASARVISLSDGRMLARSDFSGRVQFDPIALGLPLCKGDEPPWQ